MLLVDGGFVQWRELVNKECFRASLCSDTSYLNALGGWWIRAKAGPMRCAFGSKVLLSGWSVRFGRLWPTLADFGRLWPTLADFGRLRPISSDFGVF